MGIFKALLIMGLVGAVLWLIWKTPTDVLIGIFLVSALLFLFYYLLNKAYNR